MDIENRVLEQTIRTDATAKIEKVEIRVHLKGTVGKDTIHALMQMALAAVRKEFENAEPEE